MTTTTTIKHKYYLIAGESILDLLAKIDDQNVRSIDKYRTTTCIQQVVEPILSPGEYFAICYDVELPPLQTVRADAEPGS